VGLDHLKGAQNGLPENCGIVKFVWGFGAWVLVLCLLHLILGTLTLLLSIISLPYGGIFRILGCEKYG